MVVGVRIGGWFLVESGLGAVGYLKGSVVNPSLEFEFADSHGLVS